MSRARALALFPDELVSELSRAGVVLAEDEARRLMAQFFDRTRPPKRPLSKAKQCIVAQALDATRLEVLERVTDASDGFVKYLFRSPDGALSKAVRIPLDRWGRFGVCLSSQVGCGMQCAFCATGRLGLTRNLEAREMVAAFLTVRDEAPGRVTGAVFQGVTSITNGTCVSTA